MGAHAAYPTLYPSQIADLLRFVTSAPFEGVMIRCWPRKKQAQAEGWADFEIHREVIRDLKRWPVGSPRRLPPQAIQFVFSKRAEIEQRKKVYGLRPGIYVSEVAS